jgi:hypothetical protein
MFPLLSHLHVSFIAIRVLCCTTGRSVFVASIINDSTWTLCKIEIRRTGLETENTAVGISCTDHVAPLSAKVGTKSPIRGGRSVGIVRSRTKAMELVS